MTYLTTLFLTLISYLRENNAKLDITLLIVHNLVKRILLLYLYLYLYLRTIQNTIRCNYLNSNSI
jgi:hypothetical protein